MTPSRTLQDMDDETTQRGKISYRRGILRNSDYNIPHMYQKQVSPPEMENLFKPIHTKRSWKLQTTPTTSDPYRGHMPKFPTKILHCPPITISSAHTSETSR